jgi:hypothetical protein
MAVTETQLKEHMRVSSDEDVSKYLAAAQSKARTAGIPAFTNNAQYDLFIEDLATMYYDNRGMGFSDPGTEAAAQRMINACVLELRYAKEDDYVEVV